jgi:outer membrane protein OmpA-like peptidoglycan-associated protein
MQRSLRWCLPFALASATAYADPGGSIPLDSFRPAMDSRGYFTINSSNTLGDGELAFGLASLDWGQNLLHLSGGGATYDVHNNLTATLIAAYGLQIGPRKGKHVNLEFGLSLPIGIMQGVRNPGYTDPTNSNNNKTFSLDGQGIGSIGFHFKTHIISTSRPPHIGVGVMASVYVPSTSPDHKWLGDKTTVAQGIGILEKEFWSRGKMRFRVALNGGFRFRSSTTFTNNDNTDGTGMVPTCGVGMMGMVACPVPITGQSVTLASEIPYGIGASYAVSPQKFDLVVEGFGSVPLNATNYQQLEAVAGVKLYLARNSFLALGAGYGLARPFGIADKNNYAGNPDLRAFIGIVFEPNIGDRDGDGIKDDVDKCPDEPEDFDGFEDEDGCPDPDNDHDGIPDEQDKCPNVPENFNGVEDADGCPEGVKNDRDGDGIPDDVDKCPDDPEDFDGFQDADGCPDPDNDGDGILDVDDLCPNDPEDKDGFEDADGCPDPDNDHDRILDKDDKCPNEPETYNGFEDADGCPDRGRVIVTDTAIEILDMVYFEYDKAIIKKESYPILDAVAATMQGNPSIALIEIQGHTDERGDDDYNLKLSDRRAHAVRDYLIGKGVDEKRLTAQGYGETQPLDRRHNEAAWAKNRRVAFLILKRSTD